MLFIIAENRKKADINKSNTRNSLDAITPITFQNNTMAILRFSKQAFLLLGLKLASNWSGATIEGTCYNTNKERSKDFYYASPRTIRDLFWEVQYHQECDCDVGTLRRLTLYALYSCEIFTN
jgi:hypothetical protein